jgi:hypothetical protein
MKTLAEEKGCDQGKSFYRNDTRIGSRNGDQTPWTTSCQCPVVLDEKGFNSFGVEW